MKILTASIIFALLIFLPTAKAEASTVHARREFAIEILVNCMDTAIATIRTYACGVSARESVSQHTHAAEAQMLRRGDPVRYADTLTMLRGLGEVLYESQQLMHLGDDIIDTTARLAANEVEIARLLDLLARSTDLNMLITVDTQLANAQRQRDNWLGQLNFLNDTVSAPYIAIILHTTRPPDEPLPPEGFFARVNDSFMSGMRGYGNFLGNLLVGFALVSVPGVVIILLAVPAYILGRRHWKNRVRLALEVEDEDEELDDESKAAIDAELSKNPDLTPDTEGDK